MIYAYLGVVLIVIAVDLLTKFTIDGILNPGISWGLGASVSWLWVVIVVISGVLAVGVTGWVIKKKPRSWLLVVGLALFVGGMLGNTIDRLLSAGQVHDFINFVIFKNNIADLAITAGALLVGVKIAFR